MHIFPGRMIGRMFIIYFCFHNGCVRVGELRKSCLCSSTCYVDAMLQSGLEGAAPLLRFAVVASEIGLLILTSVCSAIQPSSMPCNLTAYRNHRMKASNAHTVHGKWVQWRNTNDDSTVKQITKQNYAMKLTTDRLLRLARSNQSFADVKRGYRYLDKANCHNQWLHNDDNVIITISSSAVSSGPLTQEFKELQDKFKRCILKQCMENDRRRLVWFSNSAWQCIALNIMT